MGEDKAMEGRKTFGCPYLRKVDGGVYAIRLREQIDMSWGAWFDGMEIVHEEAGTTLLTGYIQDQAALHGLLTKIRDLHLTLLSLQLVRLHL